MVCIIYLGKRWYQGALWKSDSWKVHIAIYRMLLTFWCQIQEDTFRGLVEFTPLWVRAVLVVADWCIQRLVRK